MAYNKDYRKLKQDEVWIRQGITRKLSLFVGVYAVHKEITKKEALEQLLQIGWDTWKNNEDISDAQNLK